MATSGTVGLTKVPVARLISNGLRRCGITPAKATPDVWEAAHDSLYFFLTSLSNNGTNLWCIDKQIFGLRNDRYLYALPIGTLDVLTILYRRLGLATNGVPSATSGVAANAFDQDLTTVCTQSAPNGNISYNFGTPFVITNIGICANGANTYNLIYEYSSDGVTWSPLQVQPAKVYADYEWGCFDVDAPVTAQYYRVRETSGATLNVRAVVFNAIVQETYISRWNRDEYWNMPQKMQQNRQITNFYLDRARDQPVVNIWPVPNYNFDQLVVYRHRHIQDVGALNNDIDVPIRWMDALNAGLSARMVLEVPGADMTRKAVLDAEWQAAYLLATAEETDISSINLMPDNSAYTR